jgi:radical SAM protein with 4Fe4S-binding SPASM domain
VAGIRTKFHTNATLLDEDMARRLISAGLDQISFSFDGYDKKTYESIRINADFEKTLRNIVRFLEIKKELRSRTPYAVFELINFPDLYRDKDGRRRKEFLGNFRGLPLDRLEIKEMHNWAGELGRAQTKNNKKYIPCTFLWQALVIFWDGSILPCTQDFHGYCALGNVREETLAQVWNGKKMVQLRQKVLRRDIADLKTCSQCDRLWRDQLLGVPKEYLWRFLLRRMP